MDDLIPKLIQLGSVVAPFILVIVWFAKRNLAATEASNMRDEESQAALTKSVAATVAAVDKLSAVVALQFQAHSDGITKLATMVTKNEEEILKLRDSHHVESQVQQVWLWRLGVIEKVLRLSTPDTTAPQVIG